MSNVLGVFVAVLLLGVGFILMVCWWGMFVKMLMAVVPVSLILMGAGALVYFISEIKSKREVEKEKIPGETKTEQK